MLHILTKAPDSDAAQQMLQAVGENDAIILTEAGVQAALHSEWGGFQLHSARIFLLAEDVTAWGLDDAVASQALTAVDIDGFIALTEQHVQTVTWY
ncbi:tRNA 2-thiouridine synthesizing protein B [Vreelandella songnenensis]|uniref:tRNA 2-thiouridine synthesizing protein B n=1 Tax=Vreelandella songnenensis TaxID=1176243 RepID=A0A2T0V654_9GAMM|nr:sulfurtransferase complex subunit TusB [Halomonas songnenensis]PRY65587.1 tRNA 2-thiouridine synthesizing protein B [Halomonas songnenensis]